MTSRTGCIDINFIRWCCLFIIYFNAIHLHSTLAKETLISSKNAINTTADSELKDEMKVAKSYPYYFSGFDDDNRPILICEFGKWDLRNYFDEKRDIDILNKYIIKALDIFASGPPKEKCPEGDAADGTVLIADMEGFNVRQVASVETFRFILGLARQVSKLEKHLAYGYIINLNYIGERTLEVARPLLGSFLERIDVYGTNSKHWKPKLLRVIPKSQLPPWYGGDPDFSPIAIYG